MVENVDAAVTLAAMFRLFAHYGLANLTVHVIIVANYFSRPLFLDERLCGVDNLDDEGENNEKDP